MIPFHFEQTPAVGNEKAVVLPANLKDKTELLAFLHRAIPLPDYFGHNWDALEECLRELDLLDRPSLVLIHQDVPLQNAPADQRIYVRLLADVARGAERLSVIFPESCREQIARLLAHPTDPRSKL